MGYPKGHAIVPRYEGVLFGLIIKCRRGALAANRSGLSEENHFRREGALPT